MVTSGTSSMASASCMPLYTSLASSSGFVSGEKLTALLRSRLPLGGCLLSHHNMTHRSSPSIT